MNRIMKILYSRITILLGLVSLIFLKFTAPQHNYASEQFSTEQKDWKQTAFKYFTLFD